MDIGEPQRTIIIEPATIPVPQREPARPQRDPIPRHEPAEAPERVPEKVPAKDRWFR